MTSLEPKIEKSSTYGVFEFLYPDPQLDQNLKPIRNLSGQFLYFYLIMYMYSV